MSLSANNKIIYVKSQPHRHIQGNNLYTIVAKHSLKINA
jgi:hypothetical protein